MKLLRQSYWFVLAYWEKYKKTILLSFLATLIFAVGGLIFWPALPKAKPNVYVGVVGKFTLSQIPAPIEKKLGVGLTVIGEDLLPKPGLAASWEVLEGGKRYRFKLKDNLKWSNGKAIRAEDLNFAIPNVSVKKENGVIEFSLPEAFSPFPSILSKPVIKDGLLTAGEYNVAEIKVNGKFLERVVLDSGKEQITFRFYDSVSQALLGFRLGEIDELQELIKKPEEASWPNVKLTNGVRKDMVVGVFYNTSNPLLADKSIRQALSYAIADKTYGQLRATSPINPDSWAYNKFAKEYEYSAARAKELLSKATKEPLKLELAATPELLFVAENVANDWRAVGVETEVKVVSTPSDSFQAMIKVLEIPPDPDQYIYWHSTQETNFTNLQSAKIDKLLEDGRQTFDQEQRREVYLDFQRFSAEEAPATFMYHPTTYTISRR